MNIRFVSLALLMAIPAFAQPALQVKVPLPDARKPVDYSQWLNNLLKVPESENAADLYAKLDAPQLNVADSLDSAGQTQKLDSTMLLAALSTDRTPWKKADHPRISEWLQRNENNFKLIEKASARPYWHATMPPDPTGILPVDVTTESALARRMVDLLMTQGWGEAGEGRPQGLAEQAMTVLRISRQWDRHPFLLNRLTTSGTRGAAYRALIRALTLPESTADFAAKILPALGKSESAIPDLSYTVLGEMALSYGTLQELLKWDEAAKRAVVSRELAEAWAAKQRRAFSEFGIEPGSDLAKNLGMIEVKVDGWENVDVAQTIVEVEEAWRAVESWLSRPFAQAGKSSLEAIGKSKNPIVAQFFQNPTIIFNARRLAERSVAMQHATHVIYGLWTYKHERGEFPSQLSSLRSKVARDMRIDPFSGEDLIYKRTDDGFVLYSVGTDGKDNGGKHHPRWGEPEFGKKGQPSGDYILWPPQEEPE